MRFRLLYGAILTPADANALEARLASFPPDLIAGFDFHVHPAGIAYGQLLVAHSAELFTLDPPPRNYLDQLRNRLIALGIGVQLGLQVLLSTVP